MGKEKAATKDGTTATAILPHVTAVGNCLSRSMIPKKIVAPNDPVSNHIFAKHLASSEKVCIRVRVSKRTAKKRVGVIVMLKWNGTGQDVDPLQIFDRAVLNAVVSIYAAAGEPCVCTFRDIYRVLVRDSKAKPRKPARERIHASLQRLSRWRIEIDSSGEKKLYKDIPDKLVGCLLDGEFVTVIVNGSKPTDAIKINSKPILMVYAESKGQIARLELDALKPSNGNSTETVVILNDDISRHISGVKHGTLDAFTSLTKHIYKLFGISSEIKNDRAVRLRKMRIREAAEKVYQAATDNGAIKDFKKITHGRTVEGYLINV